MDIAGSGDITNLADYVLAIHRVTNNEKAGEQDKKGNYIIDPCPYDCILDLFKNRPIGHQDKEIGLYYEHKSKRFYNDSDNLYRNYSWLDKGIQQVSEFGEECPF
jgi:twinkle protein